MSDPKKKPKDKSVEIQDLPRQEEELTPEQAEQAQGGGTYTAVVIEMRKSGGGNTSGAF